MIFFSQKINYQVLKSCTLYVVPTVPVPGVPGIWYLFESYKNLYTTWTPCTDGTYLYLCTIVANYGLHVVRVLRLNLNTFKKECTQLGFVYNIRCTTPPHVGNRNHDYSVVHTQVHRHRVRYNVHMYDINR